MFPPIKSSFFLCMTIMTKIYVTYLHFLELLKQVRPTFPAVFIHVPVVFINKKLVKW
jgi:hypothetical protein